MHLQTVGEEQISGLLQNLFYNLPQVWGNLVLNSFGAK